MGALFGHAHQIVLKAQPCVTYVTGLSFLGRNAILYCVFSTHLLIDAVWFHLGYCEQCDCEQDE